MDTSGHLRVSESTARPVPKCRNTRKPKRAARSPSESASPERALPAVGTLTRTKSLLLAALRVWELKQRIND
jgi:hypothetical protein